MAQKYKKITPLNIEISTVEECKKNFLNMSEIANKALREALNKKDVEVDVSPIGICGFCGRKQIKAKVIRSKGKDKYVDGMTWLYPDEQWICTNCLKRRSVNAMRSS